MTGHAVNDVSPYTDENGNHLYLSTSCLHAVLDGRDELHVYCQEHTGISGAKTPAQCKWCDRPHGKCICTCHAES